MPRQQQNAAMVIPFYKERENINIKKKVKTNKRKIKKWRKMEKNGKKWRKMEKNGEKCVNLKIF